MEEDEKDTEAGIHDRVQGTVGQAGEGRKIDWRSREGIGFELSNALQLGQGIGCREVERCGRQGCHPRADGAVTAQSREYSIEKGV